MLSASNSRDICSHGWVFFSNWNCLKVYFRNKIGKIDEFLAALLGKKKNNKGFSVGCGQVKFNTVSRTHEPLRNFHDGVFERAHRLPLINRQLTR